MVRQIPVPFFAREDDRGDIGEKDHAVDRPDHRNAARFGKDALGDYRHEQPQVTDGFRDGDDPEPGPRHARSPLSFPSRFRTVS